ncbi:MAG: tRNA pseudouridine(38-40) synthase TruA [Alphaproteobacteria bacterium]|nr:tRNA pseudouridine(38-40) synthase TruA [Alphaproteobacteria bacterium]
MTRYKILVEYDGTNLIGWQKQLEGLSVQECLEKSLNAFTHQNIEVLAAGRTDAGVHATAQVAHFDLDTKMELFRLREAFNAHLRDMKAPVSVLDIEPVSNDFHARFSAKGRGYVYKILNRRARPVLLENRVWWVPFPLDVDLMREGTKYLLGHHDFSAFRGAGCQALSPVKTLDRLDIIQNGDEIDFIVEAKSFIYHQVRNMVGTLKMVGDKHFAPEDVKRILESKKRSEAGVTAPASGLYLNKVVY